MATTNHTIHENETPSNAKDYFSGREYFSGGAVLDAMATFVRETNRPLYARCARNYDTLPSLNLRGAAYLLHLLAISEDEDKHQRQAALAMLSDHIATMAVVLDMQSQSDIDGYIAKLNGSEQ